jgi:NTE family protein
MPIKNIVFAGGGLKGWAYIGSLKVLKEYNIYENIEHVAGVSVGSLFALLFILQIDPDFLLDFIINLNFKDYIDIDIDNIIINQSILQGEKFTDILKQIISFKIDPDITFADLKRHSKIMFTVNALNITDSKLEYFNYKLTPNIKLIDAIRASSCLPLIFPSYRINDKYYFDGGICNNCPTDIVDDLDTIAFDITTDFTTSESNPKIYGLIGSLVNITNNLYAPNKDNMYGILDKRFNDQAINMNQTKDDIFNIYINGYINSKNVLLKNYIGLPAPP